MLRKLLIANLLLISSIAVVAQEVVGPLGYRPALIENGSSTENNQRYAHKTTAITLPFFEDFTDESFYPDTNNWLDNKVYINNTMGVDPISYGVATFDAIGSDGLPYQKTNSTLLRYADSLTSRQIDLSGYSADDSLYLSFFYQPEGNGFAPQQGDSLMLYFRRTNGWTRVWRVAGSGLQPFRQVMIPITQSSFFHDGFQFRFVNKASMSNADDTWNVDYIRLDANRSEADTLVNDVAFTKEPTFVLNDYTFMPYQQFIANTNNYWSQQHEAYIRNNNNGTVNVNYGYNARETTTSTVLGDATGNVGINGASEQTISFNTYTTTIPAPGNNEYVIFENKYYLESGANTGPTSNDTIVKEQFFYNFLAYDDDSPEKSYYLNLFPTLPGKIAIEYSLETADTLTGIAIYFGRQVPLAYQKYFSAAVYKNIAFGSGSDQVIYQEDFLVPNYLSHNRFWYYKFKEPVILQAGKFFIGTIQPALSGSDSLYFGLDVNRVGSNHVFYNVLDNWVGSTVDGAVMIRPVFGEFFPSIVNSNITQKTNRVEVTPNPAHNYIRIHNIDPRKQSSYRVTDVLGKVYLYGILDNSGNVDISSLSPGVYLVYFTMGDELYPPTKIIKQ